MSAPKLGKGVLSGAFEAPKAPKAPKSPLAAKPFARPVEPKSLKMPKKASKLALKGPKKPKGFK
jgi:hypothetical protein